MLLDTCQKSTFYRKNSILPAFCFHSDAAGPGGFYAYPRPTPHGVLTIQLRNRQGGAGCLSDSLWLWPLLFLVWVLIVCLRGSLFIPSCLQWLALNPGPEPGDGTAVQVSRVGVSDLKQLVCLAPRVCTGRAGVKPGPPSVGL